MRAPKRERNAIVQFLDNLHSDAGVQRRASREQQQRARQRLLARTRENPGKVLSYLGLLPAKAVEKNPLLRKLRYEATSAALTMGVCV